MSAISGRKVKFEVAGDSYEAYVKSVTWSRARSSQDPTLAEATAGGAFDETCTIVALQDDGGDAESFAEFVNGAIGTDVTVTWMPQGNDTPSTSQPHWTATLSIVKSEGDYLGGAGSNDQNNRYEVTYAFPSTAPTKLTAAE